MMMIDYKDVNLICDDCGDLFPIYSQKLKLLKDQSKLIGYISEENRTLLRSCKNLNLCFHALINETNQSKYSVDLKKIYHRSWLILEKK